MRRCSRLGNRVNYECPLVTAAGKAPRVAPEATIFAVVGRPAPSARRHGQDPKEIPGLFLTGLFYDPGTKEGHRRARRAR
jgi:hypothetical protein